MSFDQETEWRDLFAEISPHVAKDVVQIPDHKGGDKERHTSDDEVGDRLLGRVLRTGR